MRCDKCGKPAKHEGWSNYETWALSLWINNEEGSQRYWYEKARECAERAKDTKTRFHAHTEEEAARFDLADALKDELEEAAPDLEGLWSDLLNAALSEIDWGEVADHLLASAKEPV